MMNYSGAINVSLGYKTYGILVRPEHLEVLKLFFLAIFMILAMSSFSLRCVRASYI